jgi:hypothetical protein
LTVRLRTIPMNSSISSVFSRLGVLHVRPGETDARLRRVGQRSVGEVAAVMEAGQ